MDRPEATVNISTNRGDIKQTRQYWAGLERLERRPRTTQKKERSVKKNPDVFPWRPVASPQHELHEVVEVPDADADVIPLQEGLPQLLEELEGDQDIPRGQTLELMGWDSIKVLALEFV